MDVALAFAVAVSVAVTVLGIPAAWFVREYVWRPYRVWTAMKKLGYDGPDFHFIVGNYTEAQELSRKALAGPMLQLNHDHSHRSQPYYTHWRKVYGNRFICTLGNEVQLVSCDPEILKEIVTARIPDTYDLVFPKTDRMNFLLEPVSGTHGLMLAVGEDWERKRLVVRQALHLERMKIFVEAMGEIILHPWLQGLKKNISHSSEGAIEIDISKSLRPVMEKILTLVAFGDIEGKGKEAFDFQETLNKQVLQGGLATVKIPGLRQLPFPSTRKIWHTRSMIGKAVKCLVESRRGRLVDRIESRYEHDILRYILTESDDFGWTDEDITDQCRTLYFAGLDTTHNLISWSMVMLALYPEWQERIRSEVTETFGSKSIDGEKLLKLKQLTMFVNETLRLYPPASFTARQVKKDGTTLLGVPVPTGLNIYVDFVALHRDEENWGKDALEFKPERFAKGVTNACKNPWGYSPFLSGPRVCAGQNLALFEAKALLVAFLRQFSFCLSPSYRHDPVPSFTLTPRSGVSIILRNLDV